MFMRFATSLVAGSIMTRYPAQSAVRLAVPHIEHESPSTTRWQSRQTFATPFFDVFLAAIDHTPFSAFWLFAAFSLSLSSHLRAPRPACLIVSPIFESRGSRSFKLRVTTRARTTSPTLR